MNEQERAVMKQALEALETCDAAHISDGGRQWYDDKAVEKAITALRAALARQAEPVCKCDLRTRLVGDGCEVCNPKLAAEFAQQPEPVQEPVAWNWMLDGRPYGQAYYGNPPDADIAERAAISGRTVRLLYTKPFCSKPLTDEEILEAVGWERAEMYMKLTPNFPVEEARKETIKNARAIERKVRGE